MLDIDDYFDTIPTIFKENREKHIDLNKLILDSINDIADLMKSDKISDEVIELLKNIHSIRRKIFLCSYLLNINEYEWAVSSLRSLVESIETVLIFMIYPNELYKALRFIQPDGFKKFEDEQSKLRKKLKEKYDQNPSIIQKLERLKFFRGEFSSSWAHSNYLMNHAYSHQDNSKAWDNDYVMTDNGLYDDELYVILNIYLLKIIYLFLDVFFELENDSIFSPIIFTELWKERLALANSKIKHLQSQYSSIRQQELFNL